MTIEVKHAINEWLRGSNPNFGFVIHSYDSNGNVLNVTSPHELEVDETLVNFFIFFNVSIIFYYIYILLLNFS